MRGDAKGTVSRPASEVLTHPERWDYIEVDIPEDLFLMGKVWMNDQVRNNLGYDFKAIGSFLTPWRFHNKYKNICSEFGDNYCVVCKILTGPYSVPSPRRLAKVLVKMGHKLERLDGKTRNM